MIKDTYVEKSYGKLDNFPEGPWTGEPDKAQWVDAESNFDCLIVRNHSGALCGYVGLPPGHPMHGKDYDDVRGADDDYPNVHGGLTFASACDEENPEGICHAPLPGRPADVWWLGFDCAHYMDMTPRDLHMREIMPSWPLDDYEVYRDWEYVIGEVTSLASQLKELA